MAITIRNKHTEALIRQIGARTGEGPSAVVKRLAERALEEAPGRVSQAEYERRMAAWDDLMKLAPPRDPNLTWSEVEQEMNSIFGDGLDGSEPGERET
jgi:hypothetical protein